jgi:hypothetical protein
MRDHDDRHIRDIAAEAFRGTQRGPDDVCGYWTRPICLAI